MNFRFGPANDPFTVALECSPRTKPSVRRKKITQHSRLKWVDRSTEKNAWNLRVFVSKYWSDRFYFIANLFNFNRFLQRNSFLLNNSTLFHVSKKKAGRRSSKILKLELDKNLQDCSSCTFSSVNTFGETIMVCLTRKYPYRRQK